jgi:hypothetical protein
VISAFGVEHTISKSGPVGIGMLPHAYATTAVKGARALPGGIKQAAGQVRAGKSGRLKRMQGIAAEHGKDARRQQPGKVFTFSPDTSPARPALKGKKQQAFDSAWHQGYGHS